MALIRIGQEPTGAGELRLVIDELDIPEIPANQIHGVVDGVTRFGVIPEPGVQDAYLHADGPRRLLHPLLRSPFHETIHDVDRGGYPQQVNQSRGQILKAEGVQGVEVEAKVLARAQIDSLGVGARMEGDAEREPLYYHDFDSPRRDIHSNSSVGLLGDSPFACARTGCSRHSGSWASFVAMCSMSSARAWRTSSVNSFTSKNVGQFSVPATR